MTATYTHTGRRGSVGYMHYGNTHAFRGGATAGKIHGLNVVPGNGYMAICGTTVPTYSHDHRCDERNPVELATAGRKVTCKACLRRKPVAVAVPKKTVFVLFAALCTGEVSRLYSETCSRRNVERYAENITASGRSSITQPEGYIINAWVEDRQE